MTNPHCTVILTNWNGWNDTVECLESLIRQDYPNLDIIIVDNASKDDSVERLRHWAYNQGEPVPTKFPSIFSVSSTIHRKRFIEIFAKEIPYFTPTATQNGSTVYLIKNHINAGFAKGNNLGIAFALKYLQSDFIFLLNNDTVIERDAIRQLVETATQQPEYSAFQSAIYYYDNPERVWNLGGKILPWAQIVYYREVKNQTLQQVDFLSGCALFCKAALFKEHGLLNEHFFHGEEDFEFSLRLKRNHIKAAVVFGSKVYHKIGMSVTKQWKNKEYRILNFALNRIINMRAFYPKPVWYIWRLFTLCYFFYLMLTYYRLSWKQSAKILRALFLWSTRLKRVNRRVIQVILERING